MQYLSAALVLLLKAFSILCVADLEIVCQWNQMDFAFPTIQEKNYAISNKLFIKNNVIPIDVDVDYKGEFLKHRKKYLIN